MISSQRKLTAKISRYVFKYKNINVVASVKFVINLKTKRQIRGVKAHTQYMQNIVFWHVY